MLIALALFTGLLAVSQPSELIIKNNGGSLYLDHKVAPKEGIYSIGRVYNVHPRYLAAYNKIDINKGLNIGDVLRVPLSDTNFTQKGPQGTPVYYVVGEKEGLMKVSNAANKVALQKLRDWNNLSSDNLAAGKRLVVGYLVSKDMPVAAVKTEPTRQPEETIQPVKPPEEKAKPFVVEEKPFVKEEPKQEPRKEEPKKQEAPVVIKEEVKPAAEDGYFKPSFTQQIKSTPATKNETVTSGIFKTTSGWEDGKYYLLIDNVPTGTIVRVTNPDNNKAIYAKVLGEMSGIKQNQGLNIRISNAAAAVLGISETDKFIVKINY